MRTAIIFMSLALAGCASSTNVVSIGSGNYSISAAAAPVRGGITAARGIALEDATTFCSKMGGALMVGDIQSATTNLAGAGSVVVVFKCR